MQSTLPDSDSEKILRAVKQVDLSLRCLFDNPTIAGLAEQIEALRDTGQDELDEIVGELERHAERERHSARVGGLPA